MRRITLTRVDAKGTPNKPTAYSMELTVSAANDMPNEVFVKQRIGEDASTDAFAAVASPEQLESLLLEPAATSYFRSAKIKLVAANQAALDEMFDQIAAELQLLILNLTALTTVIAPSRVYTVTANGTS